MEADYVSIKKVSFTYISDIFFHPKFVAVDGYEFYNRLKITGTHLEKIAYIQSIDSTVAITNVFGDVTYPKTPIENTGKFVPDEMDFVNFPLLTNNNTVAYTYVDWHSDFYGSFVDTGVQPSRQYSLLAREKIDFNDAFERTDLSTFPIINIFDWGYAYTNSSYLWPSGKEPTFPIPVATTPSVAGTGAGMISGYGDGTNGFSGFEYIPMVDHI